MEDELDIRDLISALWRKKWIILIVTIISLIFAIIISGKKVDIITTNSNDKKNKKITYVESNFMFSRTKKSILVDDVSGTADRLVINEGVVTSLRKLATSRDFLKQAITNLGFFKTYKTNSLMLNLFSLFCLIYSNIICVITAKTNIIPVLRVADAREPNYSHKYIFFFSHCVEKTYYEK